MRAVYAENNYTARIVRYELIFTLDNFPFTVEATMDMLSPVHFVPCTVCAYTHVLTRVYHFYKVLWVYLCVCVCVCVCVCIQIV